MEQFELVLIILLCVGISSIADHLVSRISLPVLQVAIGLAAAIAFPHIRSVEVESDLFLVLFIAPLLFNETRETSVRQLWANRGDILSLAIGLVVVSVLAVGFALNWLEPSIPLAAAFALGAALGPTDAAAVSALGSSVALSDREKTLLSGESLINDASGVVAFQFAVAAAVTGSFSLAEAAGSFAVLFFGGIGLGIALGFILAQLFRLLGNLGLEDASSYALYELLSPFVIYLIAEAAGVSGILAVVAAGLVMSSTHPRFHSTFDARRKLVTDSMWDIVSFLINGILFVLLGMQLPHVVMPGLSGGLTTWQVIGLILAVAATSLLCRFLWVLALELIHRHGAGGRRVPEGGIIRDALVTTIAGAKGAVTLSIVLTLPYATASGAPFPQRDLIVTLAAGVILTTLLLADTALPKLAPVPVDDGEHDREVHEATIAVFDGTIEELQRLIVDPEVSDYVPALRLTLSRYQMRLAIERLSADDDVSQANQEVQDEEFRWQSQKLEELHRRHLKNRSEQDWQLHLRTLRSIRRSVGYQGQMESVVSQKHMWVATLKMAFKRAFGLRRPADEGELEEHEKDFATVYGQSCIYAIELEYASIDCFDEFIKHGTPEQAQAAQIRKDAHEISLKSLWGRLNYGRDVPVDSAEAYTLPYDPATHEFTENFREQFAKSRKYGRDVDENALRIELDVINRLQVEGEISRDVANELRNDVYLLQMSED